MVSSALTRCLPGEHGADAALGEQLEQQRVWHPRVDDVGRASAVGGPDRRFDLGDHPVANDACGEQLTSASGVELADQRAVAVANTFDVGHEDELAGVQSDGELCGDSVGVDVVGLAVVAESDRRHHRDAPLIEDGHQRFAVDLGDVTHEAEIRPPRVRSRAHQQRRPILTGKPDRSRAERVDARDDVGPDLAGQDHLRDLHGRRIGDSQAVDELGLDAHALLPRADLRAAAVHDHRSHAHEAQEHDVLEHRIEVRRGTGGAADLDDEDVPGEALDVRQCFDEHLGAMDLLVDGLFRHVVVVMLRIRWCSRR